jgi:phosphatidylserine/phosphatidylglycerophosphate/cardiolipin synthase-like enzyme
MGCGARAQEAPMTALPAAAPAITAGPLAAPVNDRDYYPTLLKLINASRSSIEICLYQAAFYEDYPGSDSNNLVDALREASRRGVAVTAVMDVSPWRNNGEHDAQNTDVGRRLAEAGVEVYMDDPEVQSHQKLAIFDRDVVVVSSTNWTHFALAENKEAGVVMWSRQGGLAYSQYFAERVSEATPFLQEVTASTPVAVAHLSPAVLGIDAYPTDHVTKLNNRWYFPNAAMAMRAAQKSIDVVQVYGYYYGGTHSRIDAIPGRPAGKPPETDLLADELIKAHQRGVRVRVLMDHTWKEGREFNWNASKLAFAQKLHDAGVEVYRDDPVEGVHAKMLVLDDDTVVVGSANWSFEALEMNNEASVLVESPGLVQEVYRPWVDDLFARGTRFDGPTEAEAAAAASSRNREARD